MKSTLIKNGTVVTASDEFVGDVFMKDGKIELVGQNLDVTADEVVDATGKYVMPGGVDQHTHFMFKMDDSRCVGWESSSAAVCGGTTTVVDFVNQEIGKSLKESVQNYVKNEIRDQACCDYAFHTVVYDPTDELFEEIKHLGDPDYGIPTVKLFMAYKGQPYHMEDGSVLRALQAAKEAGVTIMVHAESAEMIATLQQQTIDAGITGPIGHAISRPPIVEEEAVKRASYLAELAGAPIYIVHVTAKGAMEAIRDSYAKGVKIFGETCTHYLTVTTDVLKSTSPENGEFEGAKYVCSPALRSQEHLDAMWEAVKKGWLNTISSDPCAFNFEEHKKRGLGDFRKIPNGCAGVENRMQMVWTYGVETGKISKQQFVELCCTNPAKINGIYPQKGTLAPGSDADVLIYDPNGESVITKATSHHKTDYEPFEGRVVKGHPSKVYLRGELVVEDSQYVGKEGTGAFVPGKPYGLAYQK